MTDYVRVDKKDYKKLVNGKFKSYRCTTCCGNGRYWVHADGTKRDPNFHESVNDFYEHPCEDCNELGFNVVFDKD